MAPHSTNLSSSTVADTEPNLYVLYGTETGNSKKLASDASAAADQAGLRARVLGLDQLSAQELTKVRHAILVVSTTGEGEMPYNAVGFWDALAAAGFPRIEQLRYGVLALGESVYDHFCAAGVALDKRLAELGATRLIDRVDFDFDFETHAATWLEEAIRLFAQSIAAEGSAGSDVVVVSSSHEGGRPRHAARIAAKRVLTRGDTEREVVHYTIALEALGVSPAPFDWQPGDSLNLFYGNDPTLARDILNRLRLRADDVPHGADKSLGELLTGHLELRALSRELVQEAAAQEIGDELQNLLAQSAPGVFEEWRESHDLLQVLIEHPEIRFDAERLVSLLRPLQPRAYSIASSPMPDPASIDLSARTVRYRHGVRIHHGVVSGGLSQRASTGDLIEVQHLPTLSFRLPDDPATDIVMVGAGVGVAPFRAFMQHRAARGDRGRSWLLHGIRNPSEDELYADEFAAWRNDGVLFAYDVCASRVPEGKQYVQHRMAERGRELFAYLDEGAVLYVCGDARRMAKDVRCALRAIATDVLGSNDRGELFVEGLQAERRYRQDVY